MVNNVIYNGVTYDLDDLSSEGGRGYATNTIPGTGSTAKPFYVAIMEDALADAGKSLVTTSTTSITIGTGTHVFTLATFIPYKAGGFVVVADRAAPTTNLMFGQVTVDADGTVTITVDSDGVFGSGTIADWNVLNAGITGPTGATGETSRRSQVAVSSSKTLALSDEDTLQKVTSASAVIITIPANSTVAFDVDTELDFFGKGAGVITFLAAGGVTILSVDSLLSINGQNAAATIKKLATDEWLLVGRLV